MNPRFAAVEPSLIREVNARKQLGDIDLGLGEPVLRPDVSPMRQAMSWVETFGCPYTANAGFSDLRRAIARYLNLRQENILVTHGSQEAVYLAIRTAVNPARHEVLIVEPAYPAYVKICQAEDVSFRIAPLSADDGFAPRAEAVLERMTEKTRLVVLSSPCNPTARIWPRAELEKLAAGLSPSCFVLSDEVYRDLYYTDAPPTSMASLHARTIVAGGLSKSHALTGLRIGWMACPAELIDSATRAHQLIATAASTLAQRVALEVLTDGQVPHRAVYVERRFQLIDALRQHAFDFVAPQGAFYCLVRIPDAVRCAAQDESVSLWTSLKLIEERHVVTVPGIAFGASCEGWLRLSWVAEPMVVADGLSRVAAFFAGFR